MTTITLDSLMKLTAAEQGNYKLHLACWNGEEQPLNVYLRGWDHWASWNAWRGNKNDFNRDYIFSLIQFYHEPNKWLFGGIFKIVNRHDDWTVTQIGYELELLDLHKEYIGRLIIEKAMLVTKTIQQSF